MMDVTYCSSEWRASKIAVAIVLSTMFTVSLVQITLCMWQSLDGHVEVDEWLEQIGFGEHKTLFRHSGEFTSALACCFPFRRSCVCVEYIPAVGTAAALQRMPLTFPHSDVFRANSVVGEKWVDRIDECTVYIHEKSSGTKWLCSLFLCWKERLGGALTT